MGSQVKLRYVALTSFVSVVAVLTLLPIVIGGPAWLPLFGLGLGSVNVITTYVIAKSGLTEIEW